MRQISTEQRYTTAGLLGAIAVAVVAVPYIQQSILVSSAIGFGLGSAVANGFYRTADLLKNGSPERNEFGAGTLAGFAVFCAFTALHALPKAYQFVMKETELSSAIAAIIIGGSILAGFMQNRSTFTDLVVNNHQNQQQNLNKAVLEVS